MKKFIIITALLVLATILISNCRKSELQENPFDFTLSDLDGIERTLSEQKGKVLLVDFWATWCPPCRDEIPHLKELHASYKDKGLVVWGVGLDDEEKLREFVSENGIEYPILVGDESVSQKYDIQGIPTTILYNKKNEIAFRHVGFALGMEKDLEKEITQLLKE